MYSDYSKIEVNALLFNGFHQLIELNEMDTRRINCPGKTKKTSASLSSTCTEVLRS